MGSKSRPKAPDDSTNVRVIYDPDYEDPDFRQAYEEVVEIVKREGDRVNTGEAARLKGKPRLSDLDEEVINTLIERSAKIKLMLSYSADPKKWARVLIDRTLSGEMEPYEFPDRDHSPTAETHRYLRELKGHHAKLDKRYRKYDSLEKKLRKSYEDLISFYLHTAPDPVVDLCQHLIPRLRDKYSLSVIKELAGQLAGIVFPDQVGIGSFQDTTSANIAADIRNRQKRYEEKRKDSPTGIRHGAISVVRE